MPDWDDDSPQLRANLAEVFERVRDEALRRAPLTVEAARGWQRHILKGLDLPEPGLSGRFRGEPGLEGYDVEVGGLPGVQASEVGTELAAFDRKLQQALSALDRAIAPAEVPSADLLEAILMLCAWAHAEWIRIHPFANGNGRTARLWVNSIAMRYGLPPFLRLRPRPTGDYARVANSAMQGAWRPSVAFFRRLLIEQLYETGSIKPNIA
jgi:hypothetical protein